MGSNCTELCPVSAWVELDVGWYKKRKAYVCVYMCVWVIMLYSRNAHITINQLQQKEIPTEKTRGLKVWQVAFLKQLSMKSPHVSLIPSNIHLNSVQYPALHSELIKQP